MVLKDRVERNQLRKKPNHLGCRGGAISHRGPRKVKPQTIFHTLEDTTPPQHLIYSFSLTVCRLTCSWKGL